MVSSSSDGFSCKRALEFLEYIDVDALLGTLQDAYEIEISAAEYHRAKESWLQEAVAIDEFTAHTCTWQSPTHATHPNRIRLEMRIYEMNGRVGTLGMMGYGRKRTGMSVTVSVGFRVGALEREGVLLVNNGRISWREPKNNRYVIVGDAEPDLWEGVNAKQRNIEGVVPQLIRTSGDGLKNCVLSGKCAIYHPDDRLGFWGQIWADLNGEWLRILGRGSKPDVTPEEPRKND